MYGQTSSSSKAAMPDIKGIKYKYTCIFTVMDIKCMQHGKGVPFIRSLRVDCDYEGARPGPHISDLGCN